MMEHTKRPWSVPPALFSNYGMGGKGISSLLCEIDGSVSGHQWGFVAGSLLFAVHFISLHHFFLLRFPFTRAPGARTASCLLIPLQKYHGFTSPLDQDSGVHVWCWREADIHYNVVTGQGQDKCRLAFEV